MAENRFTRFLVGYLIGIGVFAVAMPSVLIVVSHLVGSEIVSNPFVKNRLFVWIAPLVFFWGLVFVVWSNIYLVFKGKGGGD